METAMQMDLLSLQAGAAVLISACSVMELGLSKGQVHLVCATASLAAHAVWHRQACTPQTHYWARVAAIICALTLSHIPTHAFVLSCASQWSECGEKLT